MTSSQREYLRQLARQLREATSGNVLLDVGVEMALHGGWPEPETAPAAVRFPDGRWWSAPPWTTNTDLALTAVPARWRVRKLSQNEAIKPAEHGYLWCCQLIVGIEHGWDEVLAKDGMIHELGWTLPLTILTAALEARAREA